MKIRITNKDVIEHSGSEQAPKDIYVKLESLERGKREILISNDCYRSIGYKIKKKKIFY